MVRQLWYAYSKTLAEKAAYQTVKENNMDLVNPSLVMGPLISPKPTSTLEMTLPILKGDYPSYPNMTLGFVHINDVVLAHIMAKEDSRASGRLICSVKVAHWSEIVEMLRAKYPSYPFPTKCAVRGKEITIHIAWMPPRSTSSDSLLSRASLRFLRTA